MYQRLQQVSNSTEDGTSPMLSLLMANAQTEKFEDSETPSSGC